jgi:polyhydroxyalkanoate synthesis repressor PhaR
LQASEGKQHMGTVNGSDKNAAGPIIIKKYANRRLYDTAGSSYVTLDHLSDLIRKGVDFEVRDAKSGADLTRQVLTQIIFEQETKGEGALPLNFLRQLIGVYGGGGQALLPGFLEVSMNSFAEAQKEWLKSTHPMNVFEKQARANMAMYEQAMQMFLPTLTKAGAPPPKSTGNPPLDMQADALTRMQEQMLMMQRQLTDLARKP